MFSKIIVKAKEGLLITAVIVTRIILGVIFIFTGYHKVKDKIPTNVNMDNPATKLFNCLIEAGFYMEFIGYCQILAGLLLITQRFATLGAIISFPIVINILVVTISLYPYFGNTLFLNIGLLLFNVFLLLFDFHKLKFIFYKKSHPVFYKKN